MRTGIPVVSIGALLLLLPMRAIAQEKDTAKYPNSRILVEPSELAELHKTDKVRVIDIRGVDAYRQGHIPGAVRLDTDTWTVRSRQPHALENQELWSELIGAIGVDPRTPVVVYDDKVTPNAARAWWLIRYVGHPDVRLLNGGLTAWRGNGGVTTRDEPKITPTKFPVKFQKQMLADRDAVRLAIGQPGTCIVDARSMAEFTGEQAQGNRGGRVPGARHLEWNQFLDSDGRFKPPAELEKLLADRQIRNEQKVITYCQSGGRAALDSFALELMGVKDVKNYYGSWAEWGSEPSLPVETDK